MARNEKMVPHGHAYLEISRIYIRKNALGCKIVSELKCCKRCGAYLTCDHKGECCIECEYYDPVDMICMAGPEVKSKKVVVEEVEDEEEIDPATFLFEDDDDEDDLSDLPPERDADDDEDEIDFDDDDDW